MAPEVCCFDSIGYVSILYSAAFYDFKCIFILGVNASNQTDKLIFILCDNVLMLQSFKVRQLKLNSHAAFPVSRFLSLHPVVFHPHAHRFFPPISSFLFSFSFTSPSTSTSSGTCLLFHLFSSYLPRSKVSVHWPSQSGKNMDLARTNALLHVPGILSFLLGLQLLGGAVEFNLILTAWVGLGVKPSLPLWNNVDYTG